MANLEAIIAEKSQQDNQWRRKCRRTGRTPSPCKTPEWRRSPSNPELYVKYLDMQGITHIQRGQYRLVMFQDPEATVFGTAERWKTLNRGVIDQERSKGVKIFARNTLGRGYRLTDAMTSARPRGAT